MTNLRSHRLRIRIIATCGLLVMAAGACDTQEEAPPPIEVVRTQVEGIAYLEENRFEEAEAVFQRLVDRSPDHPAGHAGLGEVHLRTGRLDQAAESLERAIALEPSHLGHRLLLATIHELRGDLVGARSELNEILEANPDHQRALYAIARLEVESGAPDAAERALPQLERLVELTNGNSVVRLELTEVLLRLGETGAAGTHLEEIRRQVPVFPPRGQDAFELALDAALEGDASRALAATEDFHDAMRTMGRYHEDLRSIRGPAGVMDGIPRVSFLGRGPQDLEPEEIASAIRFTDVTEDVGLSAVAPRTPPGEGDRVALAVGDLVGNGAPDVYVGSGLFYRNDGGSFVESAEEVGVPTDRPVFDARIADFDNSGHLDLHLFRTGTDVLLRNASDGTLVDVTGEAGVGSTGSAAGLFVDVDHDGDLDLLAVGEGPARLYRNNLDGTFTETAGPMGLDAARQGTGAAFADFDDDDAIDLVVARSDGPPSLFLNRREGRFEDVAGSMGLDAAAPSSAVAVGDYDNDGFPDLFLAGIEPGEGRLYRSLEDPTVEGGGFEVDERPIAMYRALEGLRISDVRFVDYDNDGWLDLLVAGEPVVEGGRGLMLFRNAGPGEWVDGSESLPEVGAVSRVVTFDFVGDGDLDILAALSDGTVRLLRNDGGNVNHSLNLRLVGLATGSGKNNHFGIGTRVEIRAGPLYQVRHVTDPVTVIGLGEFPQAEVVRVRWTNGVVQDIHFPDAATTLAEEQMLKGSCPFIYAWDGEEFVFVTDVLWQSALGMPVGIGGADSGRSYAPGDPSRQHVRIAGTGLKPLDGEYVLQFTSELWETIYLDEVRLVTVDHPDTADIFVDERFPAMPAPPDGSPDLHVVRERRPPVAATDDRGRDVLPSLLEQDHDYVATLRPGPYQGVTEPHALTLDLGDIPDGEAARLFLRGWVFPSDASINVAVAQSKAVEVIPPQLQVLDEAGEWVTVIEGLGFPAGKDKTLVVDLTDRFRSDDRSVRIRTNMEVYWDHAFVETGRAEIPTRSTTLEPTGADLRERGFSRMYRKGGPNGPHWFVYSELSERSTWRPIHGRVTRLGDVLPLVSQADDHYVVMAPGDAITLRFDAESAPPLPEGWTRTFLFYSEGWVKDADLNTATGERTDPLPFHGMSEYPYGPDEAYPSTPAHRDYLERYHTRIPRSIPGQPPKR